MVTTSQSCKTFLRSANCPDGDGFLTARRLRSSPSVAAAGVGRSGCPQASFVVAGAREPSWRRRGLTLQCLWAGPPPIQQRPLIARNA
jgi:hypothetical protein